MLCILTDTFGTNDAVSPSLHAKQDLTQKHEMSSTRHAQELRQAFDSICLGIRDDSGGASWTCMDWGLYFIFFFCVVYLSLCIIWVLERGSKTILVCALDELANTPLQIQYAPPELRAMMVQYQQVKGKFPSTTRTIAVMSGLGYAIYGLVELDGEIPAPAFYAGLATISAIAIIV